MQAQVAVIIHLIRSQHRTGMGYTCEDAREHTTERSPRTAFVTL
jgi:hypothetical protein